MMVQTNYFKAYFLETIVISCYLFSIKSMNIILIFYFVYILQFFMLFSASMTDHCTTTANSSYIPSPAVDLHVVIDSKYDFNDITKILT